MESWLGVLGVVLLLAMRGQESLPPLPGVESRRAWETSGRRQTLADWDRTLGHVTDQPPPVEWSAVEEEILPAVIRRRIRYRAETDRWTEAYLLMPKQRKGRVPGVVVFHSTTPVNMRQPAGMEGEEDKFIGLRLAERGYAALCPRCYIYDDPLRSFQDLAAEVPRRHPGWTGMRQMLWDAQRALDLLAMLPEVDPGRLGAIGHSLGAKETLYLAAFDRRVKAAVFSEGGVAMASTNWEADWYLGPQAKRPRFAREHHELLALCAPRPLLLLGGGSADGGAALPLVESARRVYDLFDAGDKLRFINHGKGHAYPPEARQAAMDWLDRWLKPAAIPN